MSRAASRELGVTTHAHPPSAAAGCFALPELLLQVPLIATEATIWTAMVRGENLIFHLHSTFPDKRGGGSGGAVLACLACLPAAPTCRRRLACLFPLSSHTPLVPPLLPRSTSWSALWPPPASWSSGQSCSPPAPAASRSSCCSRCSARPSPSPPRCRCAAGLLFEVAGCMQRCAGQRRACMRNENGLGWHAPLGRQRPPKPSAPWALPFCPSFPPF